MATVTSITKEPVIKLTPAYRPFQFEVVVSGALTNIPAAIEVDIEIDGVSLPERLPISASNFDNSSGVNAFSFFSFNIAETVQSVFNMDEVWPVIGLPTVHTGDFVKIIRIRVFTLYPDATTSLLTDAGTVAISGKVPVINASRRSDEVGDLDKYALQMAAGLPVKFLTRKPNYTATTLEDNEWLGLYIQGIAAYKIFVYDQSGTLTSSGMLTSTLASFQDTEKALLPVGAAQINAVDSGDWLSPGGTAVIDETTAYYLIQGGLNCPDGSFTGMTEFKRYYMVPSSCKKHRVHFVNSFGSIDSFTIWNTEEIEFVTNSDTFTKSLPSNFGIVDESNARIQASGQLAITSSVGNITNEEAQWLSREFGMSVMARLEENGSYIPIVVKDKEFPLKDSENPIDTIKFTIEYSQRDYSQRR